MTERLAGRTALVTGGGGGLGRAIAQRFAEEGASLVLCDIDLDAARDVAENVRSHTAGALAVAADVSDRAQVERAVEEAVAEFGRIDVLVNNAGINVYRRPFDYSDEEWRRIIDVNLTGVWFGCRCVGPRMVAQGGGAIVNVASVAWFEASYNRAPYMASKGGVGNLTRALALDLAASNVRVNAVAPGLMRTGMTRPDEQRFGVISTEFGNWYTPMRRWAELHEVANVALFLASDEASYVTGQVIAVDGGITAGNPLGRPWPPTAEEE